MFLAFSYLGSSFVFVLFCLLRIDWIIFIGDMKFVFLASVVLTCCSVQNSLVYVCFCYLFMAIFPHLRNCFSANMIGPCCPGKWCLLFFIQSNPKGLNKGPSHVIFLLNVSFASRRLIEFKCIEDAVLLIDILNNKHPPTLELPLNSLFIFPVENGLARLFQCWWWWEEVECFAWGVWHKRDGCFFAPLLPRLICNEWMSAR